MKREDIIRNIKDLLEKIMPKDASVFIFGSQARGTYSHQSDWDLLILLNREGRLDINDRGNLSMPFYMLGAELGIEINPVLYTDSEWQERNFTPFYKNVTNEKIKIWG